MNTHNDLKEFDVRKIGSDAPAIETSKELCKQYVKATGYMGIYQVL